MCQTNVLIHFDTCSLLQELCRFVSKGVKQITSRNMFHKTSVSKSAKQQKRQNNGMDYVSESVNVCQKDRPHAVSGVCQMCQIVQKKIASQQNTDPVSERVKECQHVTRRIKNCLRVAGKYQNVSKMCINKQSKPKRCKKVSKRVENSFCIKMHAFLTFILGCRR